MTLRLLTEHHLEFLSLKGDAQARLSLHLLKCHIVENHMSRLIIIWLCLITSIHSNSSMIQKCVCERVGYKCPIDN